MRPIPTVPLDVLVLVRANPAFGGTKGQSPDPVFMRCRTSDRINFKCSSSGSDAVTHRYLPPNRIEVLQWAPLVTDAFEYFLPFDCDEDNNRHEGDDVDEL